MRNPKLQINCGTDGQFYFNLRAANGEITLSSEGYTAKAGCQNGIKPVKENAPNDDRYGRKTAAAGHHTRAIKLATMIMAAAGCRPARSGRRRSEKGASCGI